MCLVKSFKQAIVLLVVVVVVVLLVIVVVVVPHTRYEGPARERERERESACEKLTYAQLVAFDV